LQPAADNSPRGINSAGNHLTIGTKLFRQTEPPLTDERIARLFNLTSLQGRALLRTTLSRHRARLRGAMEAAARRFIAACQGDEGAERIARFPNAVVIEMLNAQLAAANAPRSPIRRKPGTFDTYLVANGAFLELRNLYP
ncbi:hypothetical protein, partial [Agrobacterium tumefaciens]|uniref:hypothetical protein n=1 Tax=Agrobacterium tumefaciens TaxID=358 RepID=UPI001BA56351